MKTTDVFRVLTICLCSLVLLMGTGQAVEVTHNGSTVFFDSFEGAATGGFPDPNLWSIPQMATGAATITVLDPNSAGPGPFHGANYVRLAGDPNGGDEVAMQVDFGSFTTGMVRADFMMYVTGLNEGSGGSLLLGTSPGFEFRVLASWDQDGESPPDGTLNLLGSGWAEPGDVPIPRDVWHPWTFLFDLKTADDGSDDTYEVIVDGASSGVLPAGRNHPDVGSLRITMRSTFVDTYYVDAVPEPSSILISGCGLLALILYGFRGRDAR